MQRKSVHGTLLTEDWNTSCTNIFSMSTVVGANWIGWTVNQPGFSSSAGSVIQPNGSSAFTKVSLCWCASSYVECES